MLTADYQDEAQLPPTEAVLFAVGIEPNGVPIVVASHAPLEALNIVPYWVESAIAKQVPPADLAVITTQLGEAAAALVATEIFFGPLDAVAGSVLKLKLGSARSSAAGVADT